MSSTPSSSVVKFFTVYVRPVGTTLWYDVLNDRTPWRIRWFRVLHDCFRQDHPRWTEVDVLVYTCSQRGQCYEETGFRGAYVARVARELAKVFREVFGDRFEFAIGERTITYDTRIIPL